MQLQFKRANMWLVSVDIALFVCSLLLLLFPNLLSFSFPFPPPPPHGAIYIFFTVWFCCITQQWIGCVWSSQCNTSVSCCFFSMTDDSVFDTILTSFPYTNSFLDPFSCHYHALHHLAELPLLSRWVLHHRYCLCIKWMLLFFVSSLITWITWERAVPHHGWLHNGYHLWPRLSSSLTITATCHCIIYIYYTLLSVLSTTVRGEIEGTADTTTTNPIVPTFHGF